MALPPLAQASPVSVALARLLHAADVLRHTAVVVDRDSVVRRLPLFVRYADWAYPALAIRLIESAAALLDDVRRLAGAQLATDDVTPVVLRRLSGGGRQEAAARDFTRARSANRARKHAHPQGAAPMIATRCGRADALLGAIFPGSWKPAGEVDPTTMNPLPSGLTLTLA